MGLYAKIAHTFQVGEDANLNDARANWSETVTHATTGSFADAKGGGRYKAIADSATQSLAFGAVTTAHFVFLKASRQVTVKFNGDSNGFVLGNAAASGGSFSLGDVAITAISVTNNSGDNVAVDYELVGV